MDKLTWRSHEVYLCGACSFPIEIGEEIHCQPGVFEGDSFVRYVHPFCKNLWRTSLRANGKLRNWTETLFWWLEDQLGQEEAHKCIVAATEAREAAWKELLCLRASKERSKRDGKL